LRKIQSTCSKISVSTGEQWHCFGNTSTFDVYNKMASLSSIQSGPYRVLQNEEVAISINGKVKEVNQSMS
jgi:hypothetical protein